jgi:hypothetical protein
MMKDFLKLFSSKPEINPIEVLVGVARQFIGKHEDGSSNRADWLDVIQRKAGLVGQPWCAIIVFWEWIPQTEQIAGVKSKLIPSASVRRAAELNKKLLHKNPKRGDIGFLGTIGKWTGHMVLVVDTGRDDKGEYYITIEGNTRSNNPAERNGGEVAMHKRYRGNLNGFEELGFASPF